MSKRSPKNSPKSPKRSGSPGKNQSALRSGQGLNLINDLDPAVFDAVKKTSSIAIVEALVGDIQRDVMDKIHVIETLKKLPEFNVIFSTDTVRNVNEIAIRSYDTKQDDKYINVDGNCNEPQPIPFDIHMKDKLKQDALSKNANVQVDS
jgi:CheY-like chemotaxis protein